MAINDRISDLIYQLQMNPNSFADTIGVKGTVIYNIIKGRRSKPSYDLLQKILMTFDAINANWLLQGEGSVWKYHEEEIEVELKPDKEYERIDERLQTLISSIKLEMGEEPAVEELTELVSTLLQENLRQKEKIQGLYKKYNRILEVVRDKLTLD